MRKHQHRQIVDLLRTIKEAQKAGLYADCQDGALAAGEFIDSIEGEGTRTAALIIAYCELLYQVSTGEASEKALRRQLFLVEESVRTDLQPNRIEAVFFPYQLSMFDSLESIYLAAKEDPACDAYVVPIPYYEMNPDGSFGKMHYDGDQYPETIPVVDWQKYDVEARHPDLVFTHYPYDDQARNASIHPDFYSKRLREHCEMLVHVPYFVSAYDSVDESYGYLPGIVYAHRVIAQSEAIRQSFISHYRKYDKAFGWKGQFGKAEEKFVALGSPKFDKVINTRREDCPLPAEWEALITKPDGTRKKVILYNTHMFTWLNAGEQYFRKLRSVFDFFRSRDDAVLWWRPHPNTELNFRTQRPDLLDAYYDVVREYQEGGWGIFDETPDLHRAIAWSDAYYGDAGSSLVTLYQCTGKLLLAQNLYVISDEADMNMAFQNQYISGQYLWFTLINSNALFRMDRHTGKTEYKGSFTKEAMSRVHLYISTACSENKLYFAPYAAQEIAVYDMERESFDYLVFHKPDTKKTRKMEYDHHRNFVQVFLFETYLILSPDTYPGILIYHIASGKMEVITDWIVPLEKLIVDPSTGYFGKGIQRGKYLYLPCASANAVVEMDIETRTTKIHTLSSDNMGYRSMLYDGQNFWLLPIIRGPLVCWDPATDTSIVLRGDQDLESISYSGFHPFADIISVGNILYLIPKFAEKAIQYNTDQKKFSITETMHSECEKAGQDAQSNPFNYSLAIENDGAILAYAGRSNRLIVYSPQTDMLKKSTISLSAEDANTLKSLYLQKLQNSRHPVRISEDAVIQELALVRLADILYVLANDPPSNDESAVIQMSIDPDDQGAIGSKDSFAGGKVYTSCKNQVEYSAI